MSQLVARNELLPRQQRGVAAIHRLYLPNCGALYNISAPETQ
jgi:hypothetical protein